MGCPQNRGNFTRAADQAGLAKTAFDRVAEKPSATKVSHPSAPTPEWTILTNNPLIKKDVEIHVVPRGGMRKRR